MASCSENSTVTSTDWRKLTPSESENHIFSGNNKHTQSASAEEFAVPKSSRQQYGGFIFGILAAITFSASAFTSKLLKDEKHHTFNITLWKYQGMTIAGPILLLYYRYFKGLPVLNSILSLNKLGKTKIFFLICRATVGVGTMIFHTQALQYLQLADSSVIAYSTPIAVTILARIFLGEALGLVSILVVVTTVFGVGVLTRPPILTGAESFDTNTLIGVGFAFGGMLFLSSVFIIIRLIKDVHYIIFILFYGYVGSLEILTLALVFGVLDIPHTSRDWILAGISCVTGLLGQFCLILSLQAELAGLVSVVRTADVVCAFFWQIGYGAYPDAYSLIGAGIVIFCILFSGFLKWLSTLSNSNPYRIKLSFLLK